MKRKTLALILIGLLALAGFSFSSTANNTERVEDSCCCCCRTTCCMMMGVMGYEDIEVKVENTKDGVVVKVISKNADMVKKIQDMGAKMKEMCAKKKCCKKETKKENVKI